MKWIKLLMVSVLLFGMGTSSIAWAHRIGVVVGVPFGWAGYYPSPYYYGPYSAPVVVAPASPPVYIEQGQQSAPSSANYWHYCQNPEGYYPYVKECPGGWRQVPPQPSTQQ